MAMKRTQLSILTLLSIVQTIVAQDIEGLSKRTTELPCNHAVSTVGQIIWQKTIGDSSGTVLIVTPAGGAVAVAPWLGRANCSIPDGTLTLSNLDAVVDSGTFACSVFGSTTENPPAVISVVYDALSTDEILPLTDNIDASHKKSELPLDLDFELTCTYSGIGLEPNYTWIKDRRLIPFDSNIMSSTYDGTSKTMVTKLTIAKGSSLLPAGTPSDFSCNMTVSLTKRLEPEEVTWSCQTEKYARAKKADSPSKVGPIVGGVVGGLAGVAAIAAVSVLVFFRFCKKKPEKETQNATGEEAS